MSDSDHILPYFMLFFGWRYFGELFDGILGVSGKDNDLVEEYPASVLLYNSPEDGWAARTSRGW